MYKNSRNPVRKNFHKNKLLAILTILILSTLFISLITSFSYGFDSSSSIFLKNNINRINADPEINLPDTLVMSDPEDPYYPLAREIADSEDADLIDSVAQLYDYYPKYLIWVSSPDLLSEKKLLELSAYFKNTNRFPATGIITGLTMESARELWERGELAKEGKNYIAGDLELDGGIEEGVITDVSNKPYMKIELNKENMIKALENADYFYWRRHVSIDKWFWHIDPEKEEYEYFYSQDIPDLEPVIIHTPSCGSFMPWEENSIAMSFIEKGASAYLSNLFSPTSAGIFIGYLIYLPGKYTWEEFSIGTMAQIQNRYISRVATNMPVFFMLGNPKISLQGEKRPYEIISDQEIGNKRIIKGVRDNEGVLPLKIEGGSAYSFVKINNLASAGEDDLFYNGKIQSVNIQSDKYLLFVHDGGEFEIELSQKSPFLWTFCDAVRDSFEHSLITIGVVQSTISLVFLGIFLLIFLIYKIKKKITLRTYLFPMIAGFVLAALQLVFIYFQADKVSASSYIKIYPALQLVLGFVGTFSIVSSGLILMLAARKKILKVLGMIICVLSQFMLVIFNTLARIITNMKFANIDLPAPWNYSYVYQVSIVLVIEAIIFICLYFIFKRFGPIKEKQ